MKRVLIIEDNENNMELMSFILESSGYEVLRVYTGKDGVDTALKEKPDFILLDIQLPDILGTEVVKQIRSRESGVVMPIIAVTSFAMAGDEQRLLAAGCSGYIEKPINPGLIMEQILRITDGVA